MLKVGIVGAGKIARAFHLPAWQQVEDAMVVAICDIKEPVARDLAKNYSLTAFQLFDDMLQNCDLDIIDICTPNALHAEHILKALDYDFHVVVEKPFVTRSQDADKIIKKARLKNKKIMCAQHQRFRPPTNTARQIIASGELGDIYYTRAQAIESRSAPIQNNSFTSKSLSGGGPLMDLGSHILDVSWWLMGCPKPVSVFGHVFTKLAHLPHIKNSLGEWDHYDVEDFICAQIKFDNDAVMSLEVSYLLNSSKNIFSSELMGTKGGLVWPEMILTSDKNGVFRRSQLHIFDKTLASVAELSHFVESILKDIPLVVPPEESKIVIQMIEAIYQSGFENQLITLN